jgi:hypothetical protein
MDFIETDGGGITARVERHAAELNRSMSSIGKMSEHPSPPYNLPDIGEAPRLQGLTQRLRRLPLRSSWRLRWDLVGRLLGMGVQMGLIDITSLNWVGWFGRIALVLNHPLTIGRSVVRMVWK